jgi:hypothetical protein
MATKMTPSTKHGWLTHSWILRIPPYGDEDTNLDMYAKLHVSKYAWTERGIWYRRMNKVASVTRIAHPVDGNEDICKLQCSTWKKYQLQTSNIAAEVENVKSKKLKTVNLRKARKWWDDQGKKLKLLKTNIVTNAMSLAPSDVAQLEQFMLRSIHTEHEGNVLELPNSESPIFKVISSFSQQEQMVESGNDPGSSSGGKRRGKKVAGRSEASQMLENQIIPLANEDIASQSEMTQQSKKHKGEKSARRCPQPSQEEIDGGFVFGRNFTFEVSMANVKPPSLETTNQCVLSQENSSTVYSKLRSGEINASALLTLRPVSYTSSDATQNNQRTETVFKKRESKTSFLKTLNAMEGSSMEQKRDAMLPNIIWEPVDGQHIQYACNVLAHEDYVAGHLSREDYEGIFKKRPATIVVYNDEICYRVQSLKLNDYNTDQVYHSTLIERLVKARKQWFENGCPFRKNTSIDDQVEFLRSLPSILKVTPPTGKDSIKDMKDFYKNYLHPVMLDVLSWEALMEMCKAYEKGWTYYAPSSKVDQQQKRKRRETFSIG